MKAKRIITSILFICVFLTCFFGIVACSDDLPDNSDGVKVTLIVLDLDNTNLYEKNLTTTKSSLYEALNEFEGLQISATSSYLGAYINSISIGTIEENDYGQYFNEDILLEGSLSANTYIAVYHDIDKNALKDLGPYALDLTYSENTYFYSGVSISLLPLYDGASYILKLASY